MIGDDVLKLSKPIPMKTKMLPLTGLLFLLALPRQLPAQAILSNPIGPPIAWTSGLEWDQFLGARFALQAPVSLLSVGGEFKNISGTFFAALVPLGSMSALPVGNPSAGVPFNSGEVWAYRTFEAHVGSTPAIVTVPFATNVPAGVYGVVFGTGLYGTSGTGGGMPCYTNVAGSSGFSWSSSPWRWLNASSHQPNIMVTVLPFTNLNVALPPVEMGDVAWGDYDNDGRLDFLLAGDLDGIHLAAQFWRNTGSGFANVVIPGLLGVVDGSVAWSDYDNDGRLDFLLTGATNYSSSGVAQVWRNTGSGFTNAAIPALPGVSSYASSSAWGDFDTDGRPDLLLTGSGRDSNPLAQLWRNTGSNFSHVPIPGLPGVKNSAVAWGDFDNDGRLDFLLAGRAGVYSSSPPITQLWRNTGNGFTQVPIADLPAVRSGSVAWGDYDNDGRLDFLLTGINAVPSAVTQLWRNTGSGFTNVPIAGLPNVWGGSVAWADYDNDGRLDFLLAGATGASSSGPSATQVWRNTGSGFNNLNLALPGIVYGAAAWGDYDNDGRLDIVLAGRSGASKVAQVWRNISTVANTPPSAPTQLSANWAGASINLAWAPATDGQTPVEALTYNLRVGTAPGAADVFAPQAALDTGLRRLPAMGNVQHQVSVLLGNLTEGDYYWSVQAVDGGFRGSPFAAEGRFYVWPPAVTTLAASDVSSTGAVLRGAVNPKWAETIAWMKYGLTTKYGEVSGSTNVGSGMEEVEMGIAVSGLLPWVTYHYRVVASNSVGVTEGADMTITLPGPQESAPVLTGLVDQTLPQGGNITVQFGLWDLDTPAGALQVEARCNNPVLFPAGSVVLSGSGGNRNLTLSPDPNHSGTAVIAVGATDTSTTTTETLVVTVLPQRGSPLLYLTDVETTSAQTWQFRLMDAGTGSTNYAVEYRSDLFPTNVWVAATNVTDLGGGLFAVDAGPSQPGLGFYRVKGFRLLTADLGMTDLAADEGASWLGPIIVFDGPYAGLVSYTWTGPGGVSNGTVYVNGTTAVIPIPFVDNAGIDPVRCLTLRLNVGVNYGLAGIPESRVTIEENDAEWQGVLRTQMGAVEFLLQISRTAAGVEGLLRSDQAGFFPTNLPGLPLAELRFTEGQFLAVATNIPLPALTGSPLFSTPHRLDLRLTAANGESGQSVNASRLEGSALLVSAVPNQPHLDTALVGTFLLLKTPPKPSTNEVPLTPFTP